MKKPIRKRMNEILAGISDKQIAEKSKIAARNVISLEEFQAAGSIMLYMPFAGEVDAAIITASALASGKIVAMPKIRSLADGIMEAVRCESLIDGLETGLYGISTPTGDDVIKPDELDMIVVPGLAFGPDGLRLGRGGGFYDRFLPLLSDHAIKAGLVFAEQIVENLPTNEHDIAVDVVVTDKDVYRNT